MKIGSKDDHDLLVEDVRKSPVGKLAIRERVRIGKLNVDELLNSPEATLAGAYGRFMKARNLKPESLPDVAVKSDVDYLLAHFYETHDLWHVITGFDTDPAGEAGLQAFYSIQVRSHLPYFLMAAIMMNSAMYSYSDRHRRLKSISDGWQLGKNSKSIVGVNWKEYFDMPLVDVRKQFNIEPVESGIDFVKEFNGSQAS